MRKVGEMALKVEEPIQIQATKMYILVKMEDGRIKMGVNRKMEGWVMGKPQIIQTYQLEWVLK